MTGGFEGLDGKSQLPGLYTGIHKTILPELASPVRKFRTNRNILTRLVYWQRLRCIFTLDDKLNNTTAELLAVQDTRIDEYIPRLNTSIGIQACLKVDQQIGHNPKDILPSGSNRRGDHISTENSNDSPKKVVVYDLVLLPGYTKGHMLMSDTREKPVRHVSFWVHQHCSKCRYRGSKRTLLSPLALVPAVEHVVDKLRVRLKHGLVEMTSDFVYV